MTASCAWVFAGGEFCPSHLPDNEISKNDLFIGVDRGIEHCLASGHTPDQIIGDFDSVNVAVLNDERLNGVQRQLFPSKKASSDLELALQLLSEAPPKRVVLLGVSGGRTDHMLFNWMLASVRPWPFEVQLLDGTTCSHVLHGPASWSGVGKPGQLLSLLPLSDVQGVTTKGLQYPLSNAVLTPGSTLGLSNLFEGEEAGVRIASGALLVMLTRADPKHSGA